MKPAITGRPSAAVVNPWLTPNRETNPQLGPLTVRGSGGMPGVLDELHTHPKVAKAYDDLAAALASAPLAWVAPDDATYEEQAFTDDLQALMDGLWVDRDNDIGGLSALMAQSVTYWSRGNFTAALRWVEGREENRWHPSLDGLDLEVYPIHPSSILQWISDRNGRLTGVRQNTQTGYATIPREHLIACPRAGVVGQWEGVSMSRPLIFPFERWKSVWLSQERQNFTQAGTIILIEPQGASDADRERANASLAAWQNNLSPFLVLPRGWEVTFEGPSGAVMLDAVDKIDSYIDSTLGNQVAALSYAAHATRALGDTLATEQAREASKEIALFLASFGAQLAQWVAGQICYSGRLPKLDILSDESDETDTAGTVNERAQAVTAGLVTWTPDDEADIRKVLGMRETAPAAAPSSEPLHIIADEPRAITAPADAQRIAAGAVLHRQTAAQKWQGTAKQVNLMHRIADGSELTPLDLRLLEAFFSSTDPAAASDPERGPAWQQWHGYGGDAMRQWLPSALATDTTARPLVTMAEPAKYAHIDFTPPEGVREAAKRAMEVRAEKPESQRGMTSVGIARARDLANGRTVSPDTARRMLAYFERHEVDKKGETWDEQGKGWQAWHGWGGDAGWSWARKLVKQMDAADAKMSDRCGCCPPGSVHFAKKPPIIVTDVDGRQFEAPAALKGVEVFVSWAADADDRALADRILNEELQDLATRHTREVYRALRDGWQPGEADALLAKWIPRYRDVLVGYGNGLAMNVSRAAVREAVRQGQATPARDPALAKTMFTQVAAEAGRRMDRASAGLSMAADEICRKVQADAARAALTRIPVSTALTTLASVQLGRPASGAANIIESEGRVAAAADMVAEGVAEDLGLQPARVVRTSIRDLRRCEHCEQLSQTTFELPEQMAQWQRMPLPDPDCEGGAERCRCGWLVEWRRA
jgi:hypothetical protein